MTGPTTSLLVFDDGAMEGHDPGWSQRDRPIRLQAARASMTGWSGLEFRRAPPARREDLLEVHSPTYVDWLSSISGRELSLGPELQLSRGSVPAALAAVAAVAGAVREVCDPDAPARRALCLVRPPGHRAHPGGFGGPSLLNQVAIGAKVAVRLGLGRVWVVDWDAGRGDGTRAALAGRPEFLFCDLFAGAGPGEEVARSPGVVEVSLPMDADHSAIVGAMERVAIPAAEAFRPELVLVSAGFGAHRDDPLGSLRAEDETFHQLALAVAGVADRHAGGRLVLALEEGSDLLSLGRGLRQVVRALLAG